MRGKRLLFAVNLTLIVCLVLSPMAVFAQDAVVQPETNPAPAAEASAPAEESVVESAGDAPAVDNSAEESNEETPVEQSVEEPVADESLNTNPEPETTEETELEASKVVEENPEGTEPVADPAAETNDLLTQPDESAAAVESAAAASQDEVVVDLDLSKGDVAIEDNSTDGTNIITVKGTNADGSVNKTVANGSTIRVSQSGETEEKQNVISIILTKLESFVKVILNKLNINNSTKAPITVDTAKDTTVALELDGDNKVTAAGNAAVHKSGEGELVIQDKNGTAGSLTAENEKAANSAVNNAATIGGDEGEEVGTIVISGATVTAVAGDSAAGAAIGGGKSGNVESIIISDNSKVTANAGSSPSGGAAIGGGASGSVGSITISDSEIVNATTQSIGAAIGAGGAWADETLSRVDTITISNSKVNATTNGNGAAIGAGSNSNVTNIFIEKNSDVTAKSADAGNGAAIGVGTNGSVENITISDSTVTATGEHYGAPIGGGFFGGGVTNLTITDSTVTATGSSYVAAIGGGYWNNSGVENISISGKSAIDASNTGSDSSAVKTTNLDIGLKDAKVVDTYNKNHFLIVVTTPTPVPVVVVNPPKEDSSDEEANPVAPVLPKTDTSAEEKKDALVESKKDDAVVQSNVEITGDIAKITVTDNTGETIEPKEVTIKSVAAFEETGASEASIQLTAKLIVDVDVATMKEAAAQTGSTADVVTVTNEDSVITVKSGGAELVSVDVKAVVDAAEETVTVKFGTNTVKVIFAGTVYNIDLTGLTDLGTLTLRLENGVLKIYDKAGNLIKEVTKA